MLVAGRDAARQVHCTISDGRQTTDIRQQTDRQQTGDRLRQGCVLQSVVRGLLLCCLVVCCLWSVPALPAKNRLTTPGGLWFFPPRDK